MKPAQPNINPKTNRPHAESNPRQAQKKIQSSNLEKLITTFQTCKIQFSHFIQKHVDQHEAQKRKSEKENCHENQHTVQQDDQILQLLEETVSDSESKFHFDEEESELILEEGLLLCLSMIEKYEGHPNSKKSRTIRRTLTKSLLFLNTFLVQKIVKETKLKVSKILNQANSILLQGNLASQTSNEKDQKVKGKSEKSPQFEVPLLITNIKIPFSFYFIFTVLQEKYLRIDPKNRKQLLKQLEYEIYQICEVILLNDENHQGRNSLIRVVSESLGCFQFPITYMFLSSITEIIQSQFTGKYDSLNSESLQTLRLNREMFSLKNIDLIFEALIKHQNNSFQRFQIAIIEQDSSEISPKVCNYCTTAMNFMIQVEFFTGFARKPGKETKRKQQKCEIRMALCPYCFTGSQSFDLKKLQKQNLESEKIKLLINLFNKIFWRQNFQLPSLENYKITNINLLFLTGRCHQNDIIDSDHLSFDENLGLSETQTALLCLKTLFLNQNQNKEQFQSKKGSFISLRTLKQKIITFFQIFLNSKSQTIRQETIDMLSKDHFLSYLSGNFSQQEISDILQEKFEEYQYNKDEKSLNKIVKIKMGQLFVQIKNRIFDSCLTIQAKSMSFLLKLRSFYPVSGLKLQIFSFITQIFEEKLLTNKLKQIPMEIMRMLFAQIENECKLKSENRVCQIITAKDLINKTLKLSFTFFDFYAKSNSNHFHGDHVWELVLMVRKLIEKMLWLIDEQQKEMKTNNKKLQYENFVIFYLKDFCFTKITINCFVFNDVLLEKLISLTELDHDESKEKDVEIDTKKSRLLQNLKLILEELFQFSKEIQKNSVIAKSMEKKTREKGKASKFSTHNAVSKQKHFNLNDPQSNFEFHSPSCNLNKIIKNIVRKEKKLTLLDCEILYLLVQKNILLNFESQNNITDTPSKIKRLILSLETTTKFNKILDFIEKEIKECHIDSLLIYIKLYVVICIQINQERKVERLFIFYKNAYKYFKKSWLFDYEQIRKGDYDEEDQAKVQNSDKNDHFFIRALKTIGFLATQFEKFRKIQSITETAFSQVKKPSIKDYSIFSLETQEAINALETFPEECFVELYQQIYDILSMFEKHLPQKYLAFINLCLDILATMTNVHPHLLVKINTLIKYLPTMIDLNFKSYACYLTIYEHLISTKDSLLMGLITRSYENIKYKILFANQNESQEKYENLERFYRMTFTLLKEDIISIRDVTVMVFYGLFTKNKKINDWTKDYLEYLNQKGNDIVLFNDFKSTIRSLAAKLNQVDKYFFEDKDFFRNVSYLTQINKEKHKKPKVFLQKDLKEINIRSTFVKKISEIFAGDFDWLKYTDEEQDRCIILLLKIIEEQTELDVYQLRELISAMEKVIREYHFIILRTKDHYESSAKKAQQKMYENETQALDVSLIMDFDDEDTNMWLIGQKRRMLFLVGQIMYTFIKLINERKVRHFTKDLEKLIDAKKFNSININFVVNNLTIEKPSQNESREIIFNYQDCLNYIKQLEFIFDTEKRDYDEIVNNTMNLTREFKEVAIKMYNILFEDQKPRLYKVVQQEIKKALPKKKKRKVVSDDSGSDDDEEYSEFSKSQYTANSRQSSASKFNSQSMIKGTKKIGSSSNSLSKSNANLTKKGTAQGKKGKILSNSLPKKLQKRLATIGELNNDEEHVSWGRPEGRRSKRLMEKEEKKKLSSSRINQH